MVSRLDGILAAAVLVVATSGLAIANGPPSPWALVVGAVATLGFELVTAHSGVTVRTVWERPAVQAMSLLAAVVLVAVATIHAAPMVLSAVIGAVGAYLVLWTLVGVGVVPPVTAWRGRS